MVREREGNVEGERETGGERGEKEGERRKGWGVSVEDRRRVLGVKGKKREGWG